MSIYLRDADINDAEIILEWRNDNFTRQHSFSKDVIDPETHLKWFRSKLADENCFMYMLMDDTECVGYLRIDQIRDIGEISYMIAPDKRKMGYGKQIIQLVEKLVNSKMNALVGLVEKSNEASKKCFTANDYAEFIGGDIVCYIKSL
ncbi:MAG: GNAT family N-acetyltransferase [Candidatus Gastranaerophilales bacterium]|nr:GNAT family N-acetyltransferase [Candidatus Gastranaerophilales bacterium]